MYWNHIILYKTDEIPKCKSEKNFTGPRKLYTLVEDKNGELNKEKRGYNLMFMHEEIQYCKMSLLTNLYASQNYNQDAKECSGNLMNEILSSNVREVMIMSSMNCAGKNNIFLVFLIHSVFQYSTFSMFFEKTQIYFCFTLI